MPISQWWYGAAAGLTVVVALLPAAGCGKVSGEKASGATPTASAPASATPAAAPVPMVGQCYVQAMRGYLDQLPPLVDCAAQHMSEIAYVGAFEPAVTAAAVSDPAGPGLATADATCRTKAADYVATALGRRGVTFEIGLPPTPSWSAGARWFACEVVVVDMTETPCDQPHSAEYLGAVRAAFGAVPADQASTVPFVTACRDELAAQAGVAAGTVDSRWGYDEYGAPELTSAGVTVMQCYFVLWNQKKVSRSVLGSKGTGFPASS